MRMPLINSANLSALGHLLINMTQVMNPILENNKALTEGCNIPMPTSFGIGA